MARRPDPRDGRQCLVTLTEPGREILLDNRRRRNEWLAQQLATLTPAERDVLAQALVLLNRVADA